VAGSQTRRRFIGRIAAAGGLALASPAVASLPPSTVLDPALEQDLPPTIIETGGRAFDHVIAPVRLNGHGPFRFMVDTGANTSCVSAQLAESLKLPQGRVLHVNTVVGRRPRASVNIDELLVGDRSRRDVEAPVLPMAGFDIDGVLGIDWLKGQRLVFGFKGKTIEITKSRHETSREGRVVVPARRKSGQLTIVDADLSGERINAMIDSGSQFSLGNLALRRLIERQDATARSRATRIGLLSIAGESFFGDQLYVPFMRLGGLSLGNVPVVFADVPVFKLWDLHDKPTMMLGIDLLTQFDNVALDFGRSAVRFDLAAA
jgi:predicted aspartyl protease